MSNSSDPAQLIRIEQNAEGTVLVLEGFVGVAEGARLKDAALRALETPGSVRVACARVEYLDVAAMQVLLALAHALTERGDALRLEGANAALVQALACTGLCDALPIDVESAR